MEVITFNEKVLESSQGQTFYDLLNIPEDRYKVIERKMRETIRGTYEGDTEKKQSSFNPATVLRDFVAIAENPQEVVLLAFQAGLKTEEASHLNDKLGRLGILDALGRALGRDDLDK